jgi:hypothetical protein
MENNWIMTEKDELDYNDLSVQDKNAIFDDLNKMVYRFKDKEKRMIKASFVHRWKPESAVAFKLMVRTHQKIMALLRLPDEQLTDLQKETGRIWNGEKVQWFCDQTNEAVEEIQDLYEKLLHGDTSSHIEITTHQDIIETVRKEEAQKREALEDQIRKLKQTCEYAQMSVRGAETRYSDLRKMMLQCDKTE